MGKRIVTTIMLAGLVGTMVAHGAESGLIGWWKFDGDALDSSGNGRHGELGGDPQFVPGMYGTALEFDGDDSVTITDYKGVEGTNPFSIAAWIKTDSTVTKTIATWGSTASGAKIEFRIINSVLRVSHGAGNVNSATMVADGQWHHIALTVAANSTVSYPQMILYVDGRDDSVPTTDADPPLDIIPSYDVGIGWRSTNGDRYWEGLIDEVYMYDRVLTADEVKALSVRPRAYEPSPADGTIGVTDPLMSWKPRETALLHNVYLGTSPDLTDANLVSPQQSALVYWHDPGLAPGETYYWRIDEIDPDGTVHPGDVWMFVYATNEAFLPNPVDGAPYLDLDITLAWTSGLRGISHDVYFGTDEAAVAEGTGDTFKGNQVLRTFETGALEPNTTYHWRIDEVDLAGAKVKGHVWSFSTLPEIPIIDPNLICWWKIDEGIGSRVVDWSGHGHHGILENDPTWAEGYDGSALELDGIDDDVVYSFPQATEEWSGCTVALWAKAAVLGQRINCSPFTGHRPNSAGFQIDVDGGNPGSYRVNHSGGATSFGAVTTEWVHLVVASTGVDAKLYYNGVWTAGAVLADTMFNEFAIGVNRNHARWFAGAVDDLRIFDRELSQEEIELVMRIDPRRAWGPNPADASIADSRTATPMTWIEGDNASRHDVYVGADAAAVAAATADDATGVYRGRRSATNYTPDENLDWGQEYFWRVDEINADGTIAVGRVWSFTVADYLLVDDFESYNDLEGMGTRIYETWIDGWVNGNGATVGNWDAPFAERTIVHGGVQAMPMDYNNIDSPWYSEAERTWEQSQDWTFGDANTLVVYFRGQPPSFIETADSITLSAAGWDIESNAALDRFDECRFVYKRLDGDGSIIVRVDSLVNTHNWAKAGVMIREMFDWGSRHASVFVTPGNGVAFQRRLANNDATLRTAEGRIVAPHWVKLTRSGNTLTAQHSDDGVTWGDVIHATDPTSDTVVMSPSVYIGLALTSHSENNPTTAVFSGIQTTGSVSGSWQVADIGVTHPVNSPESVYLAVEDSAGQATTVSHPDPAATTLTDWQQWAIDLATIRDAGVKVHQVKKLRIGVGNRDNAQPDGAGRLYVDDIRITKGVPVEPNAVP